MKKHFVIMACGTSGDILPFIEIGKDLLARNQTVSFITSPYFQDLVQNNGFNFMPFGTVEQTVGVLNDPALWDAKKGFHILWVRLIEPNLHSIRLHIQSLDPADEIIVLAHSALAPLADLARPDRPSLKIVLFYNYPTIIRTYHSLMTIGPVSLPNCPRFVKAMLYFLIDKYVDSVIVPGLNRERRKLGLTPVRHFFEHLQSMADLYVSLFPEWYGATLPDYPKPFVSGNFLQYLSLSESDPQSQELTEFLSTGPPPVLFCPGSDNLHSKEFFQTAVDVIGELKARAVLITKFREQLPETLPDSVLWQKFVSFERILPKVAAIVYHGGIGTVATAGRAGIPQLLLPSGFDQFDNAATVKRLGLGDGIPMRSLTKKKMLRALSRLLSSSQTKETCRRFASTFKDGPGVRQIVDMVLTALPDTPAPVSLEMEAASWNR